MTETRERAMPIAVPLSADLTDAQFEQISKLVKGLCGINLHWGKMELVRARLTKRLRKLKLCSFEEYLERLDNDGAGAELTAMLNALSTNLTHFYREAKHFDYLRSTVLPALRRDRDKDRKLRIWSAGCAGGEEAYSVAILVHMAMKGEVANWVPRIFATDMDESALETASAAAYPRASFESTKLGILDEYFAPNGTGFEVRPFIRKMVRFSRHDLTSRTATTPPDSVFGTFDLTLCRNVLIYFSRDTQARVLGNLCKSVAKGGYLVLGESESLGRETTLRMDTVDQNGRIFRKPLR